MINRKDMINDLDKFCNNNNNCNNCKINKFVEDCTFENLSDNDLTKLYNYIINNQIDKENKRMEFTRDNLKYGMVFKTEYSKIHLYVGFNKVISQNNEVNDLNIFNFDSNFLSEKTINVISVYTTNESDPFNENNFVEIWNRNDNTYINKKKYKIHIENDKENIDNYWDFTIAPNHPKGYKNNETSMPIMIENSEGECVVAMSVDGAKEVIKDLNEIIDYIESEDDNGND